MPLAIHQLFKSRIVPEAENAGSHQPEKPTDISRFNRGWRAGDVIAGDSEILSPVEHFAVADFVALRERAARQNVNAIIRAAFGVAIDPVNDFDCPSRNLPLRVHAVIEINPDEASFRGKHKAKTSVPIHARTCSVKRALSPRIADAGVIARAGDDRWFCGLAVALFNAPTNPIVGLLRDLPGPPS